MTQFITFCRCAFAGLAAGLACGIIFTPCRFFKWGRGRASAAVCDFFTFALLFLLFCAFSVLFDFGGLRGYMLFGCLSGVIIYRKSFKILLDFCADMVYNNIRDRILKRKRPVSAKKAGR